MSKPEIVEEMERTGGCGPNLLAFLTAIGLFVAFLLFGGGAPPDQVIATSVSQSPGGMPHPMLLVIGGVVVILVLLRVSAGRF